MATSDKLYTDTVNAHIDEIYNFARYMIFDAVEADDIVQKTFLSFYLNLGKLDMSAPVRPWLFRVARNHCLDYLKKKKALHFSEVEEVVATIPEAAESQDERFDSQEFLAQVKQFIDQLPPAYREVLLLKYFEDMTFEQIAETTDTPVNTAKSNFYRGKTKLFVAMKEAGVVSNFL